MRKLSIGLLCVLLLGLGACGQQGRPTRESSARQTNESPSIISIGLDEFTEDDIRIVEEEFDISLSSPIKIESIYYIWVPMRGPTLSLTLTGVSYEEFIKNNIHFEYKGNGTDKHGELIWIKRDWQFGEWVDDAWHEGIEGIKLTKEVISTQECMALLGIESIDRNVWPHVASPPSTMQTTSTDMTGAIA